MMHATRTAALTLVAAGLATAIGVFAVTQPTRAEVSVRHGDPGEVTIFFVPTDAGPWSRVRLSVAPEDLLNPDGDATGDGWPTAYDNAAVARPECIWSSAGEDSEILFSWHDGAAWQGTLNLSSHAGADEVPRVDTDDNGNVFVVWQRTRNGREAVFFTALAGDDLGQIQNVEITARTERGRRPDIAVHDDDDAYTVSEETLGGSASNDSDDGALRVVIDRLEVPRDIVGHVVDGGESPVDLAREFSVETAFMADDNADAEITSDEGDLWSTWVHDIGLLGWSERIAGAWTDPQFLEFDPEIGPRPARLVVEEIVKAD